MPFAPKYGNREQRIQHRRNLVLRYTIAGFTLDQILDLYNAEMVKVDPGLAIGIDTLRDDRRAVMKQLGEDFNLNRESYRALLIERADLALRTLFTAVKAGNLGAIDRWLRTLAFIADVSGANAPVQVEVNASSIALSPEERAARVLQLVDVARARAQLAAIDADSLDTAPGELPALELTDGGDADG